MPHSLILVVYYVTYPSVTSVMWVSPCFCMLTTFFRLPILEFCLGQMEKSELSSVLLIYHTLPPSLLLLPGGHALSSHPCSPSHEHALQHTRFPICPASASLSQTLICPVSTVCKPTSIPFAPLSSLIFGHLHYPSILSIHGQTSDIVTICSSYTSVMSIVLVSSHALFKPRNWVQRWDRLPFLQTQVCLPNVSSKPAAGYGLQHHPLACEKEKAELKNSAVVNIPFPWEQRGVN